MERLAGCDITEVLHGATVIYPFNRIVVSKVNALKVILKAATTGTMSAAYVHCERPGMRCDIHVHPMPAARWDIACSVVWRETRERERYDALIQCVLQEMKLWILTASVMWKSGLQCEAMLH